MSLRRSASPLALALALGLVAGMATGQPVPEIQIAPPEETSPPAAAAIPEAAPAAVAIPAARDATEAVAEPQKRQRFLSLRPVAPLPRKVVMGAGLSEPGILRLTGEVAAASFEMWLPEDTALPDELVLNARSSINVLPDTAALNVSVNGAEPTALPLRNFDGFQPLKLPGSDLKPGLNRVEITLAQPHRIFCGPDASFDVWTEFDLSQSGVAFPADALPIDAQSFSQALGDQIAAGRAIDLMADPSVDAPTLRALATTLGAAMQGQGRINIRSFYDPASGNASVALIASDQSRASFRQDANGAPVLMVETAQGKLPDLAGLILPEALPPTPTEPLLPPGDETSLADLGAADIIGNTHYFRHDLRFRLPSDWLLLANQKAHLRLVYGFADDLPKGAMLLVKVNDETIRLLPLDREGGRITDPLTIPFAARILHPGPNSLSFEMMVPGDRADAACSPRRTDMLVVTNETSIEVPTSPAMSLAGVSASLSGLTAEGIGVNPEALAQDPLQRFATELAASFAPGAGTEASTSLIVTDLAGLSSSDLGFPTRVLQEALLSTSPATTVTTFRLSEAEPEPDAPAAATGDSGDWSIGGWVTRKKDRIRNAAYMTSQGEFAQWLAARKGDALLMPVGPDQPGALRLVLGPEAQTSAIVPALVDLRDAWLGEGKVVLLSNDGTSQVWASAELPQMLEAVTPLNILPILGNYASWSPFLFTSGLLLFGLISIIPALLIVILFRNRRLR